MAKPKKSKGLFIMAPGDGSVVDGKREYRVVYSIDVRATNQKQACMEAIKVLSDQVNCVGRSDTFPPVFQVIDSRGKTVTVDFEE